MRRVLTLIVVLGLGLGTYWLLDSANSTPPPPDQVGRSETTGFGDGHADDTGDVQNAGFGGSGGDSHTFDNEGDVPILREDGAPTDAAQPGPHVLVVRGDEQQPVANAEVFFLAETSGRLARFLFEQSELHQGVKPTSRWEEPELLGQRLRTDQFGQVQLPGRSGRWQCSAKKHGEFGFLVLPGRSGKHTIVLEPDEELLIIAKLATTPEQPAAAVPVAVQQEYRVNRASEVWQGTTDATGRAVVRHFQLLRQQLSERLPKDFQERFAAVATIPASPLVMVEFDGRPKLDGGPSSGIGSSSIGSHEPIRLVLPPMGTISATLVDHGGKPLLSPARIGFGVGNQPRPAGAFPLSTSSLSQTAQKPVGTAAVELPFAQVGQELSLYARYPHDRRPGKSETTAGPKTHGEQVAIKIAPLARHTVFAGRFLQPGGRALADHQVALTIWRDDNIQTTATAHTIANGQWDLVLSGRTEPVRWRMEFRVRIAATGDNTPETWLGAIIELPAWPPGQRIELGTITLGELPPLAKGIVVDDLGEPVALASINIQQEQPAPTEGRTVNVQGEAGPGLRLVFEGSNQGVISSWRANTQPEKWRSLRHLASKSEADGTFAVFAPMPSGTLRVLADSSNHFSESLPLPVPSNNLRLVIPRNGVLSGRVLLPEWLAQGAVTVTLRKSEPPGTEVSGAPATRAQQREVVTTTIANDGRGTFVLQPIRPGRYDVLVQMRNLPTEMAVLQDVLVQPGENQDPRLEPLDVRQALYRYQLRAFDDAGQPFALDGPIRARCQQPDGTFAEAGFRWQQGKAQLITAHSDVELTFFGRGFETLQQHYGPGDHDVFLKTQKPALVNLPGARGVSGPTRKVRISAILQGDTGLPASLSGTDQQTGQGFSFAPWDLGRTSGGWLGQTDLVEIPLMQAGKYQLLFRAHATESTSTPQSSVTLGTFELMPDGSTITTVPLNVEQITEALRNIDKQWQQQLERNKKRSNR